MWRYFELLSFRPLTEIEGFRADVAGGGNPRDIKFLLGEEIVARFHDEAAAVQARQAFIERFRNGAVPDEMPEFILPADNGGLGIAHVLRGAGLTGSTSEAFRMIKQGAVRIDGERVEDRDLQMPAGASHVVQVGKRKFARVVIE